MSNLFIRSIAGLVFSVAVIGSALLGQYAVGALFLFFALGGLWEFVHLNGLKLKSQPRYGVTLFLGFVLYMLFFMFSIGKVEVSAFWIFVPLLVVASCLEIFSTDQWSIQQLAITFFGLAYVIIPFSFVSLLAFNFGEFNYELPVGFFLILWANDTGAYLIGRKIGKHKLYERISPNKTIEGLFGGILSSALTGYLCSLIFTSLELMHWCVIALIVAVFANVGDLFESHIKRICGVKDSGKIIPGHGGVLDRFDGLLMALPVVIVYLKLI